MPVMDADYKQDTMMQDDRRSTTYYVELGQPGAAAPSLWQKIVGGVAMVAVFALALAFSVALFAVLATVGVAVWGYVWWKTRPLRKAMREHLDAQMAEGGARPGGGPGASGETGAVIDGEVIRDEAPQPDDARDAPKQK